MIRFFIFTFLLNISLLNVNSSEKKNDDITFISKEEEDEVYVKNMEKNMKKKEMKNMEKNMEKM